MASERLENRKCRQWTTCVPASTPCIRPYACWVPSYACCIPSYAGCIRMYAGCMHPWVVDTDVTAVTNRVTAKNTPIERRYNWVVRVVRATPLQVFCFVFYSTAWDKFYWMCRCHCILIYYYLNYPNYAHSFACFSSVTLSCTAILKDTDLSS